MMETRDETVAMGANFNLDARKTIAMTRMITIISLGALAWVPLAAVILASNG